MRVFDFLGDLRRVGISVVRPDDRLKGERQCTPGSEAGGRVGQCALPSRARPGSYGDTNGGQQRQDLGARPNILSPAAHGNAEEVHSSEGKDEPGPQQLRTGLRPAAESREILAAHDADGRDGGTIRAQRFGPADHEGGAPPERLAGIDVLAAGLRISRRKLGEDQRAENAHCAAQGPCDESEAGPAEQRGDGPRRAEDARPDHDADHDGEPVARPQGARKPGHRLQLARVGRLALSAGKSGASCPAATSDMEWSGCCSFPTPCSPSAP